MSNKKFYLTLAFLMILLVAGLSHAAVTSSNLFLDGLGFGYIRNYSQVNVTNLTATRLWMLNAPTACPANSKMTYFNGNNSICVSDNLTGTGAANQLAKFTAANTLASSDITFDGANLTIGAQAFSLFTIENISGESKISTNYTRFVMGQDLRLPNLNVTNNLTMSSANSGIYYNSSVYRIFNGTCWDDAVGSTHVYTCP
jgi:hypothetical protein